MFQDQARASRALFENLREQLILQASEAIKPLVAFLEAHECDEDEVLAAIFEAIAFEKDAELEVGAYAYEEQRDLSDRFSSQEADEYSQMLYRAGVELFREFQRHQLYQHGFLPYQFTRRHGRDLLVSRLGVPEIMHREFRDSQNNPWNPLVFGNMAWKPELHVWRSIGGRMQLVQAGNTLLHPKGPQAPAFKEHTPVVNRRAGLYEVVPPKTGVTMPAEEFLGGMAQAFKNFHERDAAAQKTTVTTPDSEVSVKRPVDEDAIAAWEREIKELFAGINKDPAVKELYETSPQPRDPAGS